MKRTVNMKQIITALCSPFFMNTVIATWVVLPGNSYSEYVV